MPPIELLPIPIAELAVGEALPDVIVADEGPIDIDMLISVPDMEILVEVIPR